MPFALTTKKPKLAHFHPEGADEHANSLMKDFDAVQLWLQENNGECSANPKARLKRNVALGIKEGVALGLEDVWSGVRAEVDAKFVEEVIEREITEELSKGWSIGIPKFLFDKLYKSYTKLGPKLAAKGESARGFNHFVPKTLSRTSSQNGLKEEPSHDGKQTPWSDDGGKRGWRRESSEDSEVSSDLPEEHNEESFDRCCVCSTLASEEELIKTTCCSKFVGSICFEEALQETGKCCLCNRVQSLVGSAKPIVCSEHELEYKVHFSDIQNQAENSKKDMSVTSIAGPSETGTACPSREETRPSLAPRHSKKPVSYLRETGERTARTSEARKPKDRTVQGKGPLSNISNEPSQESDENSSDRPQKLQPPQCLGPLKCGPEDSVTTKRYDLRLFDQAVISYLEDLSQEGLMVTVHEAIENSLPSTVHVTTFFEVSLLESGDIWITYGVIQDQVPDLECNVVSWAETLESFVRSRLKSYTVIMHKLEVESMKLSNDLQRIRAIEELVGGNASGLENCFYPTDAEIMPAASATTERKSSPPPPAQKTPQLAALSSRSSNNDMFLKPGNNIPVMEQKPAFAAFDTQVILQQPDGSQYVIPARRIESGVSAPSGSMGCEQNE